MSDHFSGPRSRTDPAADLTDMYAFPAAIHAEGGTTPGRRDPGGPEAESIDDRIGEDRPWPGLAEYIHHDDEVLRISRPPHGIGFALLMTRVHLRPVIRGAGLACVLAGAGVFAGVL